MGGSLRRSKRFRPKLTVKKKRQPFKKGKIAHDVAQGKVADLEAKLGVRPEWSEDRRYNANYAEAGLLSDINATFGRNAKADALKDAAEARDTSGEESELDEDFEAVVLKKQRKAGPAPPPRLTSHQRAIMDRLIAAHGDDVEAMKRDTKLNSMLLPPSKLRIMLQSYQTHAPGTGVDFRVPKKRLW